MSRDKPHTSDIPLLILILAVIMSGGFIASSCSTHQPRSGSKDREIAPSPHGDAPTSKLRVVGIQDGDTLTVLDMSGVQERIRLGGIDAPELGMPFADRAKQNLADLTYGKEVTLTSHKRDRYGRPVATVYADGIDINLEQIKVGLAWHYKKYEHEQPEEARRLYADAETEAKAKHLGIWTLPNPIAPWDNRARQRP